MWGIRKVKTMIRRALEQDLKEERHLNSNVSTVVNGLMAMNGDIAWINIGILFLNIKLTFYVARNALWRFMRSIRKNT